MQEIQRIQVEKMVRLLNGMGAKFHIKIEDQEFGAPIAKECKRGPITNKGVVDYVRSAIYDIAIGEVIILPPDSFDIDRVQAVVHTAVPDGVKVETTKVDGLVQVIRVE